MDFDLIHMFDRFVQQIVLNYQIKISNNVNENSMMLNRIDKVEYRCWAAYAFQITRRNRVTIING